MSLTQVVIVDDHALLRRSLQSLLKQSPDIKVVGEAENGEDAIDLASHLKPDLVLMDISMPGIGGIVATQRILEMNGHTKVLILSMYADASLARRVLRLGARGYLLKANISSELLPAIRRVQQGEMVISPELEVLLDAH
jgi:DNA-binding NarL/FixJ family response regulator